MSISPPTVGLFVFWWPYPPLNHEQDLNSALTVGISPDQARNRGDRLPKWYELAHDMTVDSLWWARVLRTTTETPRALRAVRYLICSSWLVLAVVGVYISLPGSDPLRTPPRLVLLAIGVVTTIVLTLLPWHRLSHTPVGMRVLIGWVAGDVVLLSIGVAISGGVASPFFILYAIVPTFLATAFPLWTQGVMLLLVCCSYLTALLLSGSDVGATDVFIQVSVLSVVTAIASVVTHELAEREKAHSEASRESARRAELLAKLADAAHDLSQLGPDEVLEAVVDAVMDLGFKNSDLAVIDHETQTYRIVAARGLPAAHIDSTHAATGGITGRILVEKDTVIIEDCSFVSDLSDDIDTGPQSAIGVPIWCDGQLSATLVAGYGFGTSLSAEEIETFELLADQAGHALSNARKYELERASVERLREIDRMKSEFIATVSHELRTPLTAIAGIGSTLEQRWEELPDDVRREFLGRLNSNAGVLDGIISSLLDFSRVESGAIKPHLEPVDLSDMTRRLVDRLGGLLRDHEVISNIDPGLWVRADDMLLDRVLENLIANACKHTPPGTRVWLTAHPDGGEIEVSIKDEGPGIPEHELKRLGERFFRGGDVNSRRTRGTGLGLAFVFEVLKMHGTVLQIDSEVGRGSRFAFRLRPQPVRESRSTGFESRSASR
jgi:signal transduction histidine kinase